MARLFSSNEEARNRRRTQREVAKAVKEGRRILPASLTSGRAKATLKARERYARDVESGAVAEPAIGSPDGKNLARLASQAMHGAKGNPRYAGIDPSLEEKYKKYWYHNKVAA